MDRVVIGSLNASSLRLLFYLLFAFLVQVSTESQSQLQPTYNLRHHYLLRTAYLSQSYQINLAKSNNINNLRQYLTIKTTPSSKLQTAYLSRLHFFICYYLETWHIGKAYFKLTNK